MSTSAETLATLRSPETETRDPSAVVVYPLEIAAAVSGLVGASWMSFVGVALQLTEFGAARATVSSVGRFGTATDTVSELSSWAATRLYGDRQAARAIRAGSCDVSVALAMRRN